MAIGDRMKNMAGLRRKNATGVTDKKSAGRVASSVQQSLKSMRATLNLITKLVTDTPGGRDGILTELQLETDGDNLCRDVGDILDEFKINVDTYASIDDSPVTNSITRAQVDTFLTP